jgi:hypothetical protein
LFAGRIVSFLSFLALAPNVYLISSKNSASRTTGVVSSLFFVSLMGAYYHFYIAMNDPQMLDNALMLAGLTVFVLKPRRVPYLLPVAGLVCLGGFVKQSLIPIPLTITIFLTLFDRGALLLWLGVSRLPGRGLRGNPGALRGVAKASRDPDQLRRLLSLAEVHDGGARGDASKVGGVGDDERRGVSR